MFKVCGTIGFYLKALVIPVLSCDHFVTSGRSILSYTDFKIINFRFGRKVGFQGLAVGPQGSTRREVYAPIPKAF